MGLARCALNPETMQSKKYNIKPCKKQKNIALIAHDGKKQEMLQWCALSFSYRLESTQLQRQ